MERRIRIPKITIALTLLPIFVVVVLFFSEIRSLASLKMRDDHPLYTMTYYGDYGFDEFLKTGATSDADIEKFVTKRLLKGLPIDLGVVGDGCTAFVAKDSRGDPIFARNFDFDYTPALILTTHPKDGYASVSTVNLTFAGFSADNLPKWMSFDTILTLAAPFLPFDGMNEKGVAMALLAVPEVQPPKDANKVSLNTTTAIRLVLDKAATVEEAISLLQNYSIYFSAGVNCHYLIADATGKSVIVEYWDGKLQTVTTTEKYQIASNFVAYNGLNIGEGYDEFIRYDKVKEKLESNHGRIEFNDALRLLPEVGCKTQTGESRLQWSVVYDLRSHFAGAYTNGNTDNIYYYDVK